MASRSTASATPLDLLRMTDGLVVHQALSAAAKLGISDLLKDGERSTDDIAATLQVNPDALYRTMRFLAGQGVFCETSARNFVNNPISEWMRSDVPGSVRSVLIYRGSRDYLAGFADLMYSIETGIPSLERTRGENMFDSLREDPAEAAVFDDAMTGLSMVWACSIARAYDFGRWGSLMDVGGGNGLLLATILQAHPGLQGVLVDRRDVLERARRREFWSPECVGRVRFEPADFFQAVPSGCRACLMRNVIHDWDDDRARRILRNCRQAIADDGVLLLVEYGLGGANSPTLGKTIDMIMLTLTGGRERTVAEHSELLASAGFALEQTIAVTGDVLILEASPRSNPEHKRDLDPQTIHD